MKNPRHLFILLGLLAQGLTWDSYVMLGLIAALWVLALGRWQQQRRLHLGFEALALVLGCGASIFASRTLGQSSHFFLGDGLLLLQLVRLARPLACREKLTSLVIACFHFGVLCTLAPNIRFVVLFVAAILLLPGALKETFAESLHEYQSGSASRLGPFRYVPSMRVSLWLLLGSAFAFILFPRFTGTPLQMRESMLDQGSLLDSVLDPRKGGAANSQQVLLQIEGSSVGYLRCFALPEFDGLKWHADRSSPLVPLHFLSPAQVRDDKRFLHRKVFVKTAQFLGRVVPVDGRPVQMSQNFFSRPFQSRLSGAIEVHSMWTTGNNVYEYYIDTAARPEPLPESVRQQLTFCPPQSERLRRWLQETSGEGTNTLQAARLVELNLRKNFTYQLGAPELKRLAPVDDFVFEQKRGHCERFAAAMALFLRMQGVPSRVVVGYAGTTRNLFTGRLQIRFRDAHSWAEGYFDRVGWVTFDPTPGPPEGESGSDLLDMLEALDFAWYSHIVNFNGFAQREFFTGSARLLGQAPAALWSRLAWICAGLLLTYLVFRLARTARWKWPWAARALHESQAVARHQYDEMLRALATRGLVKPPQATPLEFLDQLRQGAVPAYSEAAVVTENFCKGFYGQLELTSQEQSETARALGRLQQRAVPPARGGAQ